MTIALVLFAVAAVGGAYMASVRFRGADRPPLAIALVHGAAAAAGLIALIASVAGASAPPGLSKVALGVFVVAAAGGFVLFATHLQNRPLPKAVIVVHGLVAVIGFVLLLVAVTGAA